MENESKKICRICEQEKGLDKFRKSSKICRKCATLRSRDSYLKYMNKDGIKEQRKQYNREYKKEYKTRDVYKQSRKVQRAKFIGELRDRYVFYHLKRKGFTDNQITDELIDTQRLIIKTKRLCKTLKN